MADTVFAIDIQNESAFHLNTPPFTMTSGLVTPANGVTYNMATDKVQMADEMAVYWTNQMAEVVHQEAPDLLVDVNVFTYDAVGRSIGDFSLDGTPESPTWRDRYPFRPEALAGSEADLLDMHFYTADIGDLQADLDSIEFSAVSNACNAAGKPMIVGEFGAFKNDLSFSAAVAWKRDEVEAFADHGFQGFLYWTYDNDLQTRLWHGVEGDGEIIAALAAGARARFPNAENLVYDDVDIDNNNKVNLLDFNIISANWLRNDCSYLNDFCQGADVDRLNGVDPKDLILFAENWLFSVDPLAHWKFDDDTGSLAADAVGSHDGTLTNFPTDDSQWAPGKVDSALIFDGVDDFVDIGNDPGLDITNDLTVSAWVKTDGFGPTQFIVAKDDIDERAYALYFHWSNTAINFLVFDTDTTATGLTGNTSLFANQWYHVAATYEYVSDGSSMGRLFAATDFF